VPISLHAPPDFADFFPAKGLDCQKKALQVVPNGLAKSQIRRDQPE
jgi:hypothetical protein